MMTVDKEGDMIDGDQLGLYTSEGILPIGDDQMADALQRYYEPQQNEMKQAFEKTQKTITDQNLTGASAAYLLEETALEQQAKGNYEPSDFFLGVLSYAKSQRSPE